MAAQPNPADEAKGVGGGSGSRHNSVGLVQIKSAIGGHRFGAYAESIGIGPSFVGEW